MTVRLYFLYYKFPCLCKTFKEQIYANKLLYSLPQRSFSLVCGCKGSTFFQTDQILYQVFYKKREQVRQNRQYDNNNKQIYLI